MIEAIENEKTDWDKWALGRFQTLRSFDELGSLTYAFSPRKFGNMSYSYGGYSQVLTNRLRFAQAASFPIENLVLMDPVHKVDIEVVFEKDKGRGLYSRQTAVPATDGLITTSTGVFLGINVADCLPVIISNRRAQFVALIHAGREGTDLGISQLAVSKLKSMGFDPRDMVVGIGPGISCYSLRFLQTFHPEDWLPFVGVDESSGREILVKRINNLKPPLHRISSDDPLGEIMVDLVGYNKKLLISQGIPERNIEASYLCTFCNGERQWLYSHTLSVKYSQTKDACLFPEGRFMAVVGIRG